MESDRDTFRVELISAEPSIDLTGIVNSLREGLEVLDISFNIAVLKDPSIKDKKKDIVKRVLDEVKDEDVKVLVLFDVDGENSIDDVLSLISRSIMEGDRFACGFIKPVLENCGIGVWAIERGILGEMRGNEKDDIRKMIMDLAGKEDLEICCISERTEV